MNTERQSWLPELEPPPGGPERLRQQLANASAKAAPGHWQIALGGFAAAVAIAIALLAGNREPETVDVTATPTLADARALDRLLGRPIEFTETSVMIDDRSVSVSQAANGNPKIRVYRVE